MSKQDTKTCPVCESTMKGEECPRCKRIAEIEEGQESWKDLIHSTASSTDFQRIVDEGILNSR